MRLPYVFRWDRHGRKGEPCQVTARSRNRQAGASPLVAFGHPKPKGFNSIRVEFADGFAMVTSGNAIQRNHADVRSIDHE